VTDVVVSADQSLQWTARGEKGSDPDSVSRTNPRGLFNGGEAVSRNRTKLAPAWVVAWLIAAAQAGEPVTRAEVKAPPAVAPDEPLAKAFSAEQAARYLDAGLNLAFGRPFAQVGRSTYNRDSESWR
jgi:hypothetical protein